MNFRAMLGASASVIRGVGVLLERLYAYESTRIGDGGPKPLLQLTALRDLRMMARRHYRPTLDQVKSALGLTPA